MRAMTSFLIAVFMAPAAFAADGSIFHEVTTTIEPTASLIEVRDRITIPADADGVAEFLLNADLDVKLGTDGLTLSLVKDNAAAPDVGIDRDNDDPRVSVTVNRYRVTGGTPGADLTFTLTYDGVINNPVRQLGEDYARGFSQSPGLISGQGVYLAGSTYWIPAFDEQLITYAIAVDLPQGWSSVSQGKRLEVSVADGRHRDGWEARTPTEEIYLIAAEFTEYEKAVGGVTAMAFLRDRDDALANKYLETTAQYLEMYRGLLGPYPYSKFALVENFWETGYGMPSFTLLGQQIIRFPFILHSSYPHELLHNWWGNGVFVDFETGNWCEGLTAYMADHLVAEQRGQGGDYRRAILQKYTDYVTPENDFPLNRFRSRFNAPSEAIGYGKTAMTWNMLRQHVGDDNFKRGFQKFYRDNKYERAGFDDIRQSFEAITGEDLKPFFSQWIDQTGAPEFRLTSSRYDAGTLTLTLDQVQTGDAYQVEVPVAVYTASGVTRHRLEMTDKTQTFTIASSDAPVRIAVDPEFDVFRTLHWAEIPPSLSKAFGADKVVMVLPGTAAPEVLARYQALTDAWGAGNVTVVTDTELNALPADAAVWLLGRDNKYRSVIEAALEDYDAAIQGSRVRFGATDVDLDAASIIIAVRHPDDPERVVVWLTADNDAAVPGLARKLPHYGKYSYLAFAGTEPQNSVKGQWPAVGSPLVVNLGGDTTASLKPRPALARLAPVFSAERLMGHVDVLAAADMEGRGVGTKGIDKAADYIAGEMQRIGLVPAGDAGGWFQSLTAKGPDGEDVIVRNVVGVLKGAKAEWAIESVVVSAHYDHLGYGWPDGHVANKGHIHAGADDNASGVAVMLELAEIMAKGAPDRSIVFLAPTAEESGLIGSRHYVKAATAYPAAGIVGNVNLDTVGGLGKKKLAIFGGATAREWPFIFMGATAVTGIATEVVTAAVNASDHVAFSEQGIPAVQLFSGANSGYHRPSDTADKIDAAGMVKVATVAREAIDYLAGREGRMVFTGKTGGAAPAPAAAGGGGRRVSTGVTPDFAFSGEGVRLSGVAEGSPAADAGLLAGDVIKTFAGQTTDGLRAYSEVLKTLGPDDTVALTYERDGDTYETEITLQAR